MIGPDQIRGGIDEVFAHVFLKEIKASLDSYSYVSFFELTPRPLSEGKTELFVMVPGYRYIDFVEACRDEQGVVGSFLKTDCDILIFYVDRCGGVNQVPENVPGLCPLITIAHLAAQKPVKTAGHEGQLQVEVDLHG